MTSLQFSHILTPSFFEEYYNKNRMNYRQITNLLNNRGIQIAKSTVKKYGHMLGFGRSRNECKGLLDWSKTHLNGQTQSAMDGFLLGDGHIRPRGTLSASVKHQEFRDYLSSFFACYEPSKYTMQPHGCNVNGSYHFATKTHPDIKAQRLRWYPQGIKLVPRDVILDPLSILIWYLGDGRLTDFSVTIFTNSFSKTDVEFLCHRLKSMHINACCRPHGIYWVIRILTDESPDFFSVVGTDSPISCYNYKFAIPKWFPGSLTIKQFRERYGFSDHVVRAAINKMPQHGLVERISDRRMRITKSGIDAVIQECKKTKIRVRAQRYGS